MKKEENSTLIEFKTNWIKSECRDCKTPRNKQRLIEHSITE